MGVTFMTRFDSHQFKDFFLLDPSVSFLNHGSFGACPKPVMDAYQAWQRRLERQPVQFLGVEFAGHMQIARQALGLYLNAAPEDLVFVHNATFGVNVIARSLKLGVGDEILSCDHEYGACDRTWQFVCQKSGAVYIRQPIPLPPASVEEIVERVWSGVTERTRLLFLSHIASPTALTLPVAELCARARQVGILTLIDGAHAPGQIPLNLQDVSADFYTGNCHKWMMAPKGAAFLYARREVQELVEPLVVSWGWQAEPDFSSGSQFVDYLQWRGTDDPSACLAVPAAIQFMQEHHWEQVRQECHALLEQALHRINNLTGLPPAYPPEDGFYHQMGIAELPRQADLRAFKRRLYEEYRVEAPCIEWNGRHFIRISVQGYNTQADIDRLLGALEKML
jgi:isopenicillin-N epimerase